MMPSYVNIGAWVGPNTMVDTWATVGSCAQIGADVHLAGGVGVGGVLEPVQARPVIVEDGAFIGSRCILTEGVLIGERAVLAPNVSLTGSVPVIDVTGPEPVEYRGYVPPYSVVVPGTRPKEFPAGTFQIGCALIIGKRSAQTDLKTSLNDVLREYEMLASSSDPVSRLGRAGQRRAPVVQAHAQVAAREVHEHLAFAVRRRGDRDRARAGAVVSPTPRSQTRAVTSPGPSMRATCTFVRFGKRGCVSSSGPSRGRSSGSPTTTACGLPTSTGVSSMPATVSRAPTCTSPMSDS